LRFSLGLWRRASDSDGGGQHGPGPGYRRGRRRPPAGFVPLEIHAHALTEATDTEWNLCGLPAPACLPACLLLHRGASPAPAVVRCRMAVALAALLCSRKNKLVAKLPVVARLCRLRSLVIRIQHAVVAANAAVTGRAKLSAALACAAECLMAMVLQMTMAIRQAGEACVACKGGGTGACAACIFCCSPEAWAERHNVRYSIMINTTPRASFGHTVGYKCLYFRDLRAEPRILPLVYARCDSLADLHTLWHTTAPNNRCPGCTASGCCTDSAYSGSFLCFAGVCFSLELRT
jgi:hypothetical protein